MNDLRSFGLRTRRVGYAASLAVLSTVSFAQTARPVYKPTPAEVRENYARADQIRGEYASKAFKLGLSPNWLDGGKAFWYQLDLPDDVHQYIRVDASSGKKTPLFDADRLAAALKTATGKDVNPKSLIVREIEFLDGGKTLRFDYGTDGWKLDLAQYTLEKTALKPRRPFRGGGDDWSQSLWEPDTRPQESPDHKWVARINNNQILVKPKDGEESLLATGPAAPTYLSRIEWTPDSQRIIATNVTPGDRKQVYLLESTPADGGPAKLKARVYDRPGDKVDTFTMQIAEVATKTVTPVAADPLDYGDMPNLRWCRDKRYFTYEKMDRGYGRWRVIRVDTQTGATATVVDDDPETFFDSTAAYTWYADNSDEIIWRSERSGWAQLYLASGDPGKYKPITSGKWVVREVTKVDEKARNIIFTASGVHAGEDPYFLHYFRVNFDGSGLKELTPAVGNHAVQFSPDGKTLIDTYSQINVPPVHELRSATDGKLITELERADISALTKAGWSVPEPFVAKGRDGVTDIYGVIYRPSKYDPSLSYPVVEDIYAGPQDSFVPKSFSAGSYYQSVAELGFIVVKIDGMGTRNRSKAFHDVCYKNIADAGFPDRILWMKAMAAKYPYADVTRVGIYGTSAGGQNSTGAVLFHPEFYKVAVSSCGCHDNRLDKIWWNEQWMGPIGPHYAEQSNITNAGKLKGKLLLMVGELDDNVPPETTYRLADALEKARREFELVLLPGFRHTAGGPFGERKRRDFFVKNLLGVDPPNWNE